MILSEAPDSEAAILFESLDEDLQDFFFNAKVQILSKDENDTLRKNTKLPGSCRTPIKTFEEDDVKILIYKSYNIKCIRCQKYSVGPMNSTHYKEKPVMEKICSECQSFLNYRPELKASI